MKEAWRVRPLEFDMGDPTSEEAKEYSEALVELVECKGFGILCRMIDGMAYRAYRDMIKDAVEPNEMYQRKGNIEALEVLTANVYEQIDVARDWIRKEGVINGAEETS